MGKQFVLIFLLLFVSFQSTAQRNVTDSTIGTPWVSINYGASFTDGDLINRHGFMNHAGMFGGYKTKRNWIYGAEASYLFGNDIRVSGLFDHLVDEKGTITDQNGDIETVLLYSRGLSINGSVGKILPILNPNPNSGVYLSLGIGFLAHKIRIETQEQVVPQLELDYRKGYDRLSQGLNLTQFIGYAFMANKGFVNFYGGLYFQEGFTYNSRDVFFDQPNVPVSSEQMLDLQYGVRLAWLIPVYKRKPKEFYFN